jgi:hypothetical protein
MLVTCGALHWTLTWKPTLPWNSAAITVPCAKAEPSSAAAECRQLDRAYAGSGSSIRFTMWRAAAQLVRALLLIFQ